MNFNEVNEMKFIFKTDYVEKPLWNAEERMEAVDKMFAMALDGNLNFIVKNANEWIAEDHRRGVEHAKDIAEINEYEIGGIICFEDCAIDEFEFLDDEGLIIRPYGYEVVTEEVAISNDMDWLSDENYTDEDRASYVLGEVMSDYTKLPLLSPTGVQYYFKLI